MRIGFLGLRWVLAVAVAGGVFGLSIPTRSADTGPAGSDQPVGTLQPVLALRYMIATNGVYGDMLPTAGGEQALGEIRLFAGTFVPDGWASCDGQLLPIASNTALFSYIGTAYGGDGVSSFALPDLRGRAAVQEGNGRWLGIPFGSNTVTLTPWNLPSHTHTMPGSATGAWGFNQPYDTCQPSLPLIYGVSPQGVPPYMSEIRLFPYRRTGSFWQADGRPMSVAEWGELFALIGTMYGGDGVTTFNLPDLQGRVAVESGQGPGVFWLTAAAAGAEGVTLLTSQIPGHTHATAAGATGATGGGQAHNNLQPTLAVRFAIAYQGYYPGQGGGPGPVTGQPMLGEVRPFAANALPAGWAFCDGQLLSIAPNAALFSLLTTTYGGNGMTTFALPDLRGRTPIGRGARPEGLSWTIGDRAGSEYTTLPVAGMATHTHAQPPPEMDVRGSGVSIAHGDATPGASDSTQFPDTDPTGGSSARDFTVHNTGLGDLTLSGAPRVALTGSPTFSVTASPAAVVAPGGSTSFQVSFAPSAEGGFTAVVFIDNEDPDEAPYLFAIGGNGVIPLASRHPGALPGAGDAGVPLTLQKNVSDLSKLDLAWGAACGNGVTGYAVYEGVLGSFTSHALLGGACNIPVLSVQGVLPGSGDRYYLVSAVDGVAGDEGSLGQNSSGGEIPSAASPCGLSVDLTACD